MRKPAAILALATSLALVAPDALACTSILVTKGASADGSTMITYAADSHELYGELYFTPAGVHPFGAMREIVEWDTGKTLGRIPQAPVTYQVVGNVNEHQVAIGETTFGGRKELAGPAGIIDYGSLMWLGLERGRTAREAIDVMTKLVDEFGYASTGESISIADPNEAWVLEIIGKGEKQKGAVWVAVRVPDGLRSSSWCSVVGRPSLLASCRAFASATAGSSRNGSTNSELSQAFCGSSGTMKKS